MPAEPGVRPLISVIIPTYNRKQQVGAAVESALSQNVASLEVLVIDDASTDGTLEELRSLGDPRVRVLSNNHCNGPAGARNCGMAAATGDLIALLDSDDLYLPGHLPAAAAVFAREPAVDLVFGRATYVQAGNVVPYMGPNLERKLCLIGQQRDAGQYIAFDGYLFDDLLDLGCFFNLSTVVFRRSIVDASYFMDEQLSCGEDWEYWQRLSARFHFAFLKDQQIVYHLHDTNLSHSESAERTERNLQADVALFGIMLGYPGLASSQRRKVRRNLAQAIFELGYFSRAQGLNRVARAHYRDSMRVQFSRVALGAYLKSFLM
jgi:glycosyltransferase involved in cell wall biosynthesis